MAFVVSEAAGERRIWTAGNEYRHRQAVWHDVAAFHKANPFGSGSVASISLKESGHRGRLPGGLRNAAVDGFKDLV